MTSRRPSSPAEKVASEEELIADPTFSRTTRSFSDRTLIHLTFNRDNGAGVITVEQNGHNLMAFTIPKEQPIKEPELEGR